MGDEREKYIQRPKYLPNLRQRSMSNCGTGHAADEQCDTPLVTVDEFENNYVSLSNLKEYNLIAR